MRLILVGNFGVQNIGDEVLREYFLHTFPEHEWSVVSAHPENHNEVHRLPFGIRSFFRPWWCTVGSIARADGLVFGGGSLFTDIESVKAPMLWWCYAAVARVFRVPVHLSFQGIGPFRTSLGTWCAQSVCTFAKSISVRDAASLARIASWLTKATPVLTFDPSMKEFSRVAPTKTGRRLLLLPRSNSTEIFLTAATKLLEEEWDDIYVLLMQPTVNDKKHAERLRSIAQKNTVTILEPKTVSTFLETIAHASFVLTQRFHGALAARAMNIPFSAVSQHENDKLSQITMNTDIRECLRLVSLGEECLRTALQSD